MLTILPEETPVPQLQQYLQGAIAPRPICFASTVDAEGNVNLAPFSFFNIFSSNPPILVFSPALSGRDGSSKHTLDNVKAVPEVVINVVTYAMVEKASLASAPYPKGVDEFVKAGFTQLASDVVKPPRVSESPVQLECRVLEIKPLGEKGGAGNLVICEVLRMHIDEGVLDENGSIDQRRIDLVSRMGGDFYCRAYGDAVFIVKKPGMSLGIGVDKLPPALRQNPEYSHNDIGKLASVEQYPLPEELHNAPKMARELADAEALNLLSQGRSRDALILLVANYPC